MRQTCEAIHEWMEDSANYPAFFWGLILLLPALPVFFWLVLPKFFVVALFLFVGLLLTVLRFHFDATPQQLFLESPPHADRPTGFKALIGRLRLGVFGAVTSYAALSVYWLSLGAVDHAYTILAGGLGLAVLAALRIDHILVSLLWFWQFMSDIVFDAIAVWIAVTRKGDDGRSAQQKLYNFENPVFVAVAGYQSSWTFGADTEGLICSFPVVDFHRRET